MWNDIISITRCAKLEIKMMPKEMRSSKLNNRVSWQMKKAAAAGPKTLTWTLFATTIVYNCQWGNPMTQNTRITPVFLTKPVGHPKWPTYSQVNARFGTLWNLREGAHKIQIKSKWWSTAFLSRATSLRLFLNLSKNLLTRKYSSSMKRMRHKNPITNRLRPSRKKYESSQSNWKTSKWRTDCLNES